MSTTKATRPLTSENPINLPVTSLLAALLLLLYACGAGGRLPAANSQSTSPVSATPTSSATPPNSMIAAATTLTPPPQAAGYTLVFQDTFDPLSLSPNGEGNYTWYEGQWWQTTLPPISAISSSSSGLTLNWEKGMAPELDLVSASHNGHYYNAWRYGYFEASLKWPSTTTGAWPAFWMLPIENVQGSSSFGELDIMEGQGGTYPSTVFTTIHNWVNGVDTANNESSNANTLSGVTLSQYHTYGVLWTPGTVTWYFDNQPINTASTYPIFDTEYFYVLFTNQVGVNWTVGDMKGVTASDIQTNVQWVHVWQKP